MNLRRRVVAVAAATCLTLAGCSGADDPDDSGDPDGPGDGSPSGGASAPADLETYFAAIAHRDPDELESAIALARPGSIAYDYAGYTLAIATASLGEGTTPHRGELSEAGDGFRGCEQVNGEESCVTWSDVEVVDGQLVDFTIDGERLDDRLSTGDGEPVSSGTLAEATLLYTYQSVQSGALYVLAELTTAEAPVSLDLGDVTYRGDAGLDLHALDILGPTELEAGSTATIALVFPSGETGGVAGVTLHGDDPATEEELELATPRCHGDPADRTCTQAAA